MGCFLLPGAAAVIAGGKLTKILFCQPRTKTGLQTNGLATRSLNTRASLQKKSDTRMWQSKGGRGVSILHSWHQYYFLKKKRVAGAQPEPNTWSFSGSILWNAEHLLQWELRILDRGRDKQDIGLVQWGLFAQAPCRKHMNVGIWQSSLALWKIKTVEVSVCTHCFNLTLLGFYLHFCMGFIANFMLVLPELMPCCCSFLENFHLINVSSTVPLII